LLAQLKSEVFTIWPDLQTASGLKDLGRPPLPTATIRESLRQIPSGVSLTCVVPPTGAITSDRYIPSGATISMAILHVHEFEDVFEDTFNSKLDRWLRENAEDLEKWLVPLVKGHKPDLTSI